MKRSYLLTAAFTSLVMMSTNLFAMQIFVKTMNGKSNAIDIEATDTVATLKSKVADKEGVPAEQQRLVYNGKQLEDEATLESYEIKEQTTVHLVMRLKGGVK